jgi:arylformamidase
MGKIYDISQTLRPELPVWPGDTAFSIEETWAIGPDCPVKVSKLTLSTHSGSHADAPSHYDLAGKYASELELEPYIGACVLITAGGGGDTVTPDDLDWDRIGSNRRVLIRTYSSFPSKIWDHDFRGLDHETIERLNQSGCQLVGVDAASIDPQLSKTMDAHQTVRRHNMCILEGLVFDRVPDGQYELIALPLKIAGADASPIRAILKDNHD